MEYFGNVNFLKGALVYSDMITTVSKRYSQEIQTTEFGFGLEGVLKDRAQNLVGILNGVDYDEWNPQTDKYIASHYSAEDLTGKQECKRDLLENYGMADADANWPVIGIVSRFAAQKGFDLIGQVIDRLALENVLILVLGSGDRLYEEMFLRLARRVPEKVAVRVAYDNALAHKIEAGADMFLMPSRYEPSGLSQLYSLKYGTVPIVRATGGLDDTVDHWDPRTKKGTGFKFQEYTGDALLRSIHQALQLYRDQESWQKLMRNGMAKDFSWRTSAREYIRAYERVRQQHVQGILV
jgi:starch synthase